MAVAVAALVICPAPYPCAPAYGCVWGFVIRLLLLILGYFLWWAGCDQAGAQEHLHHAPTHRHVHTTPSLQYIFHGGDRRDSDMWALLTSLEKYRWTSH
uniref:Putative secreted peptide n=1 Tax=Anopheles braziliensis TaxID=58242 RepID=A0A2M3ZTG8_9DIPT